MSSTQIINSHLHADSKETDIVSKKNTINKENTIPSMNGSKKNNSHHTENKGNSSRADNLDSIIINLSQLDGQEFEKKREPNENMNNISDLIKKRPQFTYLSKQGDDDFFVYNKIIRNDKTNNMSTQDNNNKKSSNQGISNLDNGFIMETSQSKNSNKERNLQGVNAINYKQYRINQKIEKMITMNNKIKTNTYGNNNKDRNEVKFTCCLTNYKK